MALVRKNQAAHSSLVRRTLWRIETELSHAPSLSDLANAEGVNQFHLTRAFSVVTGRTAISYVRARRLSEAAIRLRNRDDRLLNISLDAGYDSHEAFARAFKDMFGAPPSTIRANPDLISRLQEPITMTSEQQPTPEPRIVHRPAQKIVGVSEAYTMETRVRIPAQWERAVDEFGPKMCGGETFGVCYGFDGVSFRYLAGIAADRSGGVDWPDHVELPAARYAVFDHGGHISHIPDTWTAIFESWAPTSGLQIAEAPQFELYSEDFDPSGSGRVSIWIPVEGD